MNERNEEPKRSPTYLERRNRFVCPTYQQRAPFGGSYCTPEIKIFEAKERSRQFHAGPHPKLATTADQDPKSCTPTTTPVEQGRTSPLQISFVMGPSTVERPWKSSESMIAHRSDSEYGDTRESALLIPEHSTTFDISHRGYAASESQVAHEEDTEPMLPQGEAQNSQGGTAISAPVFPLYREQPSTQPAEYQIHNDAKFAVWVYERMGPQAGSARAEHSITGHGIEGPKEGEIKRVFKSLKRRLTGKGQKK
jgi:hypothetical protein